MTPTQAWQAWKNALSTHDGRVWAFLMALLFLLAALCGWGMFWLAGHMRR